MQKKIMTVLFNLLLLAGCASQPAKPTAQYAQHIGSNPLFMDIGKGSDGKYYVLQLSSGKGNIRVNDLSPTFNTVDIDCHGKCYGDEKTFRKAAIKKTVAGGLSVLVSALSHVGTQDQKMDPFMHNYFDRDAYEKAVNEALNNSHIDRSRLLADYDNYVLFQNNFDRLNSQYKTQNGY